MVTITRANIATGCNVPNVGSPAPAPLQVSTLPLPDDIRIAVHMAPDAPVGCITLQIGLGQGSRGRGERIADDHALHVAICRRLAAHLNQYARDYEVAAQAEHPDWWQRLAAAACALDPSTGHCRTCGAAGTLPSTGLCPECADLSTAH